MFSTTRRFPGESDAYRQARERLLEAESRLRDEMERVAEMRRALPLGGKVPQDYAFDEVAGRASLSQLFRPGHGTLLIYSYMFGEGLGHAKTFFGEDITACPMCSSFLDGLDAQAQHLTDRVSLAVVSPASPQELQAQAERRAWKHLRLLSVRPSSYNADYGGVDDKGQLQPMLNVFVRRDDGIYHSWGSELLYATKQNEPRHLDTIWPLWNVLDLTPEGRGTKWYPRLEYAQV